MLRRFSNSFKRGFLKKTPLKKKPKHVNREELEKMRDLFLLIWRKRPHVCIICGAGLGSEPHSYNFDHILEKSKYPELKFEEQNIALVCLDCHATKCMGFFPPSYAKLIEKTKELFGIE